MIHSPQLEPIHFPEILSQEVSETKANLTLRIPPNLFYLEGHFPGMPILPGVVQLHWAVFYAKTIFYF